ncbi:6-phosphofructo-2-kinase/fructose-2,6-bisphosphatase [Desulfovibrio sp.]|uniref:histidine phosphatase family protein n=1 Tax=Desulfovibrio sp. TaxID=885 RepID=UPI0023D05927|nr:6-phosphofructo-2-kinase/fructose-2,6-bisphosphatase [Desulfovibrio sp.]MDE7241148.1 6-phosphofructo-2-kinase/fructose-2,6-bisphosphatase [Desulfovibrio sp.]
MHKLYVAMVGLPARGKSTMARRIRDGLLAEGIAAKIFNNGDVRRQLLGSESTEPDFYNPDNSFGRQAREMIARRNLEEAQAWLASDDGEVAILDATNASRARRQFIESKLRDHPVLFVECVNEDPLLLNACIRRKADLPEYASYTKDEALKSFLKRIEYYETIYDPLTDEKYWMCVDSTANRVLAERPCEISPYYAAIREIVVSVWTPCLYLARHGQTEFNIQGRIGGDPPLTAKGRAQAQALARHMEGRPIDWVFTSTRMRSHETAAPLLESHPEAHVMALREFDEIWAGDCENMLYSEIREKMPEVTAARNADKYAYAYPNGESYAILRERVQRGLRRALFLAGDQPLLILGHQAINRVLVSLFLRQRTEDVPYIHIPQNQYFHIALTPHRKLFERIPYEGSGGVPVDKDTALKDPQIYA